MAKKIMVMGTMSNVGKSLIAAGLCRIFFQDGYQTAPFKSQNMALNSYITEDGFEMGRAQAVQAEAAGVRPDVRMNPILLKPVSDMGSQVIVNGSVIGNMKAKDYFSYKQKLIPDIMAAYDYLDRTYDIIVIEGAGSPAEINLKENDIVNMGLAKMTDAPVILVGDIDRGGVFAQLYGTVMLLEEEECERIQGLVINKFRGDVSILEPGLRMLEDQCKKPVFGVIPYIHAKIDDEDSLSERLVRHSGSGLIDIVVIRLPRISNFTDFNVFESFEGVSLRYAGRVSELGEPDMVILPGSKNTGKDLLWLRESGLEAAVKKANENGCVIFGICGGYQMLGNVVADRSGAEGGGVVRGLGLLDIHTDLQKEKRTVQVCGRFEKIEGTFQELSGMEVRGYEIHMGTTKKDSPQKSFLRLSGDQTENLYDDGVYDEKKEVYGTYVHGIFDSGTIAYTIVKGLAGKKGVEMAEADHFDYAGYRETQYDILAGQIRENLDMKKIYECMGIEKK